MKSDYQRIAQAIEFINANAKQQPSLENIAAHLHLSPFHFQRLFSQWAGVAPKKYLQILTVDRAKQLLAQSKPLAEVSDSVGLSGSSRLHDHFVQLEAASPGEFKAGGAGMEIRYSVIGGPFGDAFIAVTPRGICKLSFLSNNNIEQQIVDLNAQWPAAKLVNQASETTQMVEALFAGKQTINGPLSLYVKGTNFQINVWRALLQIEPGCINSYAQVAAAVGKPKAYRAVGTAIGSNQVAFFIPCHRVLQQSGQIGGYLWGETRKHAIHAWESARY
ncbi:MAG: methylated-DNA--[protein]-cysteine S-methyltransferase [Porticoccaceae bacterium]|jgi:AraC family transcriptional regulator of adaptative response/methylated-DNA-[protein]-cysteine methyltransferase|nr:methylated-DNA--[protein]-cysteine S-methyltransferase [Porticoccaceae bacterium]MDG1448268.1 methylated-DNA--[protein]-cysteine S-methyltransferase [Porticoccaceae bacterium]